MLQHLAQALNDDDIDAEMLMKMSAIELKACGASMGKALKFVATREQSSTT
jgi:citrate lyase synthetase